MKKLLAIAFFLLSAGTAHASTQVIVGSSGATASVNGAVYSVFGGTLNNNSFNQLNAMPFSGTVSNLYIYIPTQGGGASTRTVTVRKNKAAGSTLTCTIDAVSNTCTDAVHTLSFIAGDSIDISNTVASTPAGSELRWSVVITPTNANDTVIGSNNQNNGSGAYGYMLPYSSGPTIQTLANIVRADAVLPEAGTLDLLFASSTNSFTSGSWNYAVMQNDATSTLACTADTVTAPVFGCSDITHSLSFAQGNTFNFSQASTSAGTISRAGFGVRWRPTVAGNFAFLAASNANNDVAGATRYLPIAGTQAVNATEASSTQVVGTAITITSMSVVRFSAPGAGKNVVYTLRKNGADTALTCTLTGAGSGAGITTKSCTGTVNVVAGDLLSWSDTLDAAGTAATVSLALVAAPTGGVVATLFAFWQWFGF